MPVPVTQGIPRRHKTADSTKALQPAADTAGETAAGPPLVPATEGDDTTSGASEPKATRRVSEAQTFLKGCLPVAILAKR